MGKLRKKIGAFLERRGLVSLGYTFFNEIKHLIRLGSTYPTRFLDMPDKNLTFISIPKTACSSVKASIANRDFKDDNSVHRAALGLHRHFNPHSGYFRFSFVRNPFDRLVSCYVSKYRHDAEMGNKYLAFNYYMLRFLSKDRGFERFTKLVCVIPKRLAEEHFRPQFASLYRRGKCIADFIGKFENLEADYEPIRQKHGFAPLKHYNKSGKGDWRDYYTPKTAKMVYRKYRKDFETFGYQDEYTKLLAYLAQKEKGAI